jgi:ABC-2 type transport system permease protein
MMIRMSRVKIIIGKEWADVFRNRMVLYVALLLPILFIAMPVIMLYTTRNATPGDLNDAPAGIVNNPLFAGFDPAELLQSSMVNQFMLFFMLIPLAIPMTFAAYGIVGEKQQKSLEPLLATPISVAELLLGKNLAAVLPAIAASWFSFAVFVVLARFIVVSDRVFSIIVHPMWLAAVLFLAPLLAVLAVSIGTIISSRVNDPRAAEQLGMLIILPVLALFFAQIVGLIFINMRVMLLTILAALVIDIIALRLSVGLFQRETILTRWK